MSTETGGRVIRSHRGSFLETSFWLALLVGLIGFSSLPLIAEASGLKTFQPRGCEFQASIAQDAQVKTGWRGENLLTTAVQKGERSVVRASCGAYFVRDWRAFRKHLPEQLERAARLAGIENPKTSIRRTRYGLVASYWGFRGDGPARTYFRSDSYVGDQSYLEIVMLAPPQARFTPEARQVLHSVRR